MIIKGLIDEDFINYKYPSMVIMFPYCTFKCGMDFCQNSPLAKSNDIELSINEIIERYINNNITKSIIMQGLEPFDSFNDMIDFISEFRKNNDDDIVIYSGYNKKEINDKIKELKKYKNIIVKYGRFVPNNNKHYDKILGINLVSDNQYAERIS